MKQQLLDACRRLVFAAAARDNHMGDPCGLIAAKDELAAAAKHAREVMENEMSAPPESITLTRGKERVRLEFIPFGTVFATQLDTLPPHPPTWVLCCKLKAGFVRLDNGHTVTLVGNRDCYPYHCHH